MALQLEVNLRIPAVKEPVKTADGWPINNADVRFTKCITAERLPKVGDAIELAIEPDHRFHAIVARTDWHEAKEMFVVACKYAKQSIPRPQYLALIEDPTWTMIPLLQ